MKVMDAWQAVNEIKEREWKRRAVWQSAFCVSLAVEWADQAEAVFVKLKAGSSETETGPV